MGMGLTGDSNTIIGMNFRWLMSGYGLHRDFMRKVKFDYVNKTIEFEYLDAINGNNCMNGLIWATKLGKGTLKETYLEFTALDGCGFTIYKMYFEGLKLLSHKSSDFDYNSSNEVSAQKITVSYQRMELKLEEKDYNFGDEKFTLQIFDTDGQSKTQEVEILLKNRPSMDIKEASLGFLNSKTYLSGQAQFQKIKIEIKSTDLHKISDFIQLDKMSVKFDANIISNDNYIWELKNALVSNVDCKDNLVNISISYDRINYNKNSK